MGGSIPSASVVFSAAAIIAVAPIESISRGTSISPMRILPPSNPTHPTVTAPVGIGSVPERRSIYRASFHCFSATS